MDTLGRWEYHLRASGLRPRTVQAYLYSVRRLELYVGSPAPEASPEDIAEFLTACLKHYASGTAATHYRGLLQFYRWAVTAQVVDSSPMVTLRKPRVQEPPVPVVSQDDFRAVLDTCRRDFLGLRDAALLHLFHSTGGRLSELADLHLHNLDEDRVSVLGKGGRHRILPVSPSTKQALGSYLGARPRHPYASLSWLWLSKEGHFTGWGIRRMMGVRCERAGVTRFHPHQLRHTFAHDWLSVGGSEGDLMTLAGWSSRQMLRRYGASMRSERAFDAHRRIYA